MNEIIFLVEETPEGGLTARALGHSIYTDADTITELHTNVREAITCHFDSAEKPAIIRLHFVCDEVIAAETLSHSPLKTGTLSAFLNDVAQHFNLSRDELLSRLV